MNWLLSYLTQHNMGVAFTDGRTNKTYYTFIDCFGQTKVKTSRWALKEHKA